MQEPLYISVIDVIPAAMQKQLSELAGKQQVAWALESQLNLLNSALPRIQNPNYTLPGFNDEENALLRKDRYAAQLAQIKLFEITHARASAEAQDAEAIVLRAKGETDEAARLLQRAADLRNSIPAMEAQLSALRDEAAEIHA